MLGLKERIIRRPLRRASPHGLAHIRRSLAPADIAIPNTDLLCNIFTLNGNCIVLPELWSFLMSYFQIAFSVDEMSSLHFTVAVYSENLPHEIRYPGGTAIIGYRAIIDKG